MSTLKKITEKISCRLEILTPVHVGSGNIWKEGIDFISKGEKVYMVDFERFFALITETDIRPDKTGFDQLLDLLSKGKSAEVAEICNELHLDPAEFAIKVFHTPKKPHSDIRPLIRTGMGVPYIPGSSIKGALRSVIFNYLYNRFQRKPYNKFTEKEVLGDFDKAITRFIHPSDVEIPATGISNLDTWNLYLRGMAPKSDYKQNLPITVEHFLPGKGTWEFRLAIDEDWLQFLQEKFPGNLPANIRYIVKPGVPSIPFLFNMVNEYTNAHLRREIDFFSAYPQAEDTDLLIENLEMLRQMTINNPDSCVLRLSYGSGFHGITGDWRFLTHTETIDKPDWENKKKGEPTRYKSRKIVGQDVHTNAMGFVKITLPEGYSRIPFLERPEVEVTKKTVIIPPTTVKTESRETTPAETHQDKPTPPPKAVIPIKYKDISDNTLIPARIVQVGKPFCKVELLIEEYPFDNKIVDMSGAKGQILESGQIVKVLVNSRSKEGDIKTVTLKT